MEYLDFSTLRLVASGGVATVTLSNPPLNLLDAALLKDLDRFAEQMSSDTEVRVVVFESGDPDFFISRGDLDLTGDAARLDDLPVARSQRIGLNGVQRVFECLRGLPQLTIGKLAGIAQGAGAEFLSALDMRFGAYESARLSHADARLGVSPCGGATVYLPRIIGRARTLEVILGAESLDAVACEKYGWLNRAIPDSELDHFVDSLARRAASWPPGVISATKKSVDANGASVLSALGMENRNFRDLVGRQESKLLRKSAFEAGAHTRDGEKLFSLPSHEVSWKDKTPEMRAFKD